MTNESENVANRKTEAETQQIRINAVLNVAAQVGDEQTLKAICEIMEWNFDELQSQVEQMKEEQNLNAAKASLEGVVTNEPTTEISPETIPQ